MWILNSNNSLTNSIYAGYRFIDLIIIIIIDIIIIMTNATYKLVLV